MRTIKFRAWDEDERKFINKTLEEIAMETWGSFRFGDEYTGLKDKNGVEIYEGDILQDGVNTGAVRFITPRAAFGWSGGMEWGEIDGEDAEVIGNIWENPELLK